MKKQKYIKFFFVFLWFMTLIFSAIWGYDNPEKIENIKSYFKKNKTPKSEIVKSEILEIVANSFIIEFTKVISLEEKTAFVAIEEKNNKFDENLLKIYTQNGYVIEKLTPAKISLPNSFTLQRNGGIKTVFFHNSKVYALISSSKPNCFYASIVMLEKGNEIFKTECLPDSKKNTDFNGLGSANLHFKDSIYLSLGTPEQHSSKIASLAQNKNSMFGKILKINKKDLDDLNSDQNIDLKLNIYTMGHRTPQGLASLNGFIFNTEHGPKGGDELNKLIPGKNYGWPNVSYGTQYMYDDEGKSYKINHEDNGFEEPLYAFVPSIGISSLNVCPKVLKNYYKKPCLIALSLRGNNLSPGRSIIIYLLDNDLSKIHSIEKINFGEGFRFRHFVTNLKNELYEDENGQIYLSVDKKGIYRLNFTKFR
tara:strand:+ start:768 stop:2033 length:1266 start_codon:yes stop_codon:yes gene_type:complete